MVWISLCSAREAAKDPHDSSRGLLPPQQAAHLVFIGWLQRPWELSWGTFAGSPMAHQVPCTPGKIFPTALNYAFKEGQFDSCHQMNEVLFLDFFED